MYHQIVTNILKNAFASLSQGDPSAILSKLAPQAEHYFVGEHALSGSRHTHQAIEKWYARLLRFQPDIHFTIRRIQVSGPPWHTLAVVEWTETNSGTDGIRTSADGVNVIELRWGKVSRIAIYTDTARLQATLERIQAAGMLEAHAAPIIS